MSHARLLLAAALALAACAPASEAGVSPAPMGMLPSAAPMPDTAFFPSWARDASIYEINVRQFTPEGTFAALERHLPRLDSLGVDILWLMPVQPIGVEGRKGRLGSYYSIQDYTAINPEHGTEADARRFVDAAHRLGMRVILDWVANHTSHDHAWTRENRSWYTLRPDGSISFPRNEDGTETDWTDVAELNYGNAEMRRAQIAEMKWWLERMNLDGFRMDVAWGVPHDFWSQVHRDLSAVRPDVFLLAEAEDPRLHASFHATYGWKKHHLVNEIARGKKPASALAEHFAEEARVYSPSAMRMYFTSNHDENSWQGTEFERMGANHAPAFVLSATVRGSIPLVYTGQEVSLNKRLRFFDKDTVDWSGPPLAGFYRSVLALKKANPALANGPWGGEQVPLATDAADRVFAFTRTQGANTVLVAVNFGAAPARVAYRGLGQPGRYTDWFSGATATLAATGTLEIPANGYRVLTVGARPGASGIAGR